MALTYFIDTLSVSFDDGEGSQELASLRNVLMTLENEMLPQLHPDQYGTKSFVPGRQTWRASGGYLSLVDSVTGARESYLHLLEYFALNKTPLGFSFVAPNGKEYSGTGVFESFQLGGAYDALYSGSFSVVGVSSLTAINVPSLFFYALSQNAGTASIPAGAVVPGRGLYRRYPNGAVVQLIDDAAGVIHDWDLWENGNKIMVYRTSREWYQYNLNGIGGVFWKSNSGDTEGQGNGSIMRDSVTWQDHIYYKHTFGPYYVWEMREVNLNDPDDVNAMPGTGVASSNLHVGAYNGRIYNFLGTSTRFMRYWAAGASTGIDVLSDASGRLYPSGGVFYRASDNRVYFYGTGISGTQYSSITGNIASYPLGFSSVSLLGVWGGTQNPIYDSRKERVYFGSTQGLKYLSNPSSIASAVEEGLLYNGALVYTAQMGTLNIKKVVPWYK